MPRTPQSSDPEVGKTRGGLWLAANKDSLRVVYAFNNNCETKVAAGFRRRPGIVDVAFYDPVPHPDPSKPPYDGLLCEASIDIIAYEAVVPAMPPGRYEVNVFQNPDTTYFLRKFASAHDTVSIR